MLDYTNDPKLIERAFKIVVRHDVANVGISVNGDDIYTVYEGEEELLRLLALSPLCTELELLRDTLNEVLGKPVRPALSSTDEMEMVRAIILKQLQAGHISEVMTENGEVYIRRTE